MKQIIVISFLFINLFTLIIFYIDKLKAKKKVNRISEKSLLTLCAFGGTLGGFIAMQFFRHKTKKRSFLLPFYIIIIIQIGLLYLYVKQNKCI